MQNCKSLGSLLMVSALMFAFAGQAWGLSGTVTDNRIGAGSSTLMVFAMPHQTQIDPYLVELECASSVTGTYPNYSFDLPCVTSGTYDIGIVGWDGSPEGSPSFVTDIQTDIPYNATGISLNVQPNANHISGDLYQWGTGNPVTQEGEIWAFDQSGNLAGLAFADSFGHYDFGYLPAGNGSYDMIVRAAGYWQVTSTGVSNPSQESFILRKAFQSELTNSENTGYNYNYTLHPERRNWVLSDASNYYLTVHIKNDSVSQGAQPIGWVMIRLPGGAFAQSKFYAFPSSAAHTVDPGLDWDSVYVDQVGSQDAVIFAQGNGVQVIGPKDSAWFRIEVASMGNVSNDNYTNLEVIVSTNNGNDRAYSNTGLAQKILRITNLSFFPGDVDSTNQAAPASYVTVSAVVENHGNGTFYPYDNWSNIWSAAFSTPGSKVMFSSLGPGSSSEVAVLDAQLTGAQGSYEISCNVSDSANQNTSWIPFEESLQVISTGVKDRNQPGTLPQSFALSQNFPNPFNATTRIDFALASSGLVTLEIYNLLGQKVRTLVSEYQTPGYKTVIWDGKNQTGESLASGVYFYRLNTPTSSFTKKMALVK